MKTHAGINNCCPKSFGGPSKHFEATIPSRIYGNTRQVSLARAHRLRGGASDSRLRGPGFETCAVGVKTLGKLFTLHCPSSLSCINEYLIIDKLWICVQAVFAHYMQHMTGCSPRKDWILRCIRTYVFSGNCSQGSGQLSI